MKILDTSIYIKHFLDKDKSSDEIFYVTDEIQEELDLALIYSGKSKPKLNIKNVSSMSSYSENEILFYKNYKYILDNNPGILSFYNLKGLGDISIVALVKTMLEVFSTTLFDANNEIEIWTDDSKTLGKVIEREFKGNSLVKIINPLSE